MLDEDGFIYTTGRTAVPSFASDLLAEPPRSEAVVELSAVSDAVPGSVTDRSDAVKEDVDKTAAMIEAEDAFTATTRDESTAQGLGKLHNALINAAKDEWNTAISDTFNRLNERIKKLQTDFRNAASASEMQRIASEADQLAERRDKLADDFRTRWQQRSADRRTAEMVTDRQIFQTDDIGAVDDFPAAFQRSEDRETIGSFAGVNIELGTFGRNAMAGAPKKIRLDRNALEQIMFAKPLTARRAFRVIKTVA